VDRVVDGQVAILNERIESRPLIALLLPKLKDAGIEFSTSSNCINISFGGSSAPEAKVLPVEGLEPSDTELWIQSALIAGPSAEIPKLIDHAGEWLSQQLPDVELPAVDPIGLSVLPLNVEIVGDWLVVRSIDRPIPKAQVAGKASVAD
jgi:hypothetical protein